MSFLSYVVFVSKTLLSLHSHAVFIFIYCLCIHKLSLLSFIVCAFISCFALCVLFFHILSLYKFAVFALFLQCIFIHIWYMVKSDENAYRPGEIKKNPLTPPNLAWLGVATNANIHCTWSDFSQILNADQ